FTTGTNSYGVFRIYSHGPPSLYPDTHDAAELYQSPNFDTTGSSSKRPWWSIFGTSLTSVTENMYAPFNNATSYLLTLWSNTGENSKSIPEIKRLVQILRDPRFNMDDLRDYNPEQESKRFDCYIDSGPRISDSESLFNPNDGWTEATVSIRLPYEGLRQRSENDATCFDVENVLYCRPLEVLKSALNEASAEGFHWFPFREYWKSSEDAPAERLYSELYTANAFIEEYAHIVEEQSKVGTGIHPEAVIIGIMLWSDSTHLSSFGNASLWPIYMYIGNQSKYLRCKTSLFAAHHLAYIPKLSDKFQDFYKHVFGVPAAADVITHCKRELMHLIWLLIIDDDFMHAYVHGFCHEFIDGVTRLVFPRFFTYAADYPEKVLLACIKFLAECPCPRCGVLKPKICNIGTKADSASRNKTRRSDSEIIHYQIACARDLIFTKGIPPSSLRIKGVLGTDSLTPVRSAFSQKLFPHGFNHYQMLVPDLMHEFELGVWKAIFIHLMRILHANGSNSTQDLNARYRLVRPFGRGTIRRFGTNASSMKKLAARDYEDLLQCAIPVFEQLLQPPHDKIVSTLLFELATWHAFAKLRLHTESSVRSLENSTQRFGKAIRHFRNVTCTTFITKELPSEQAARGRRVAALRAKQPMTSASTSTERVERSRVTVANSKEKQFNLSTYKLHALGDYAYSIRMFGTTDSYTTQVGETQHKLVKKYYSRASKAHPERGISKQQRRERALLKIAERCNAVDKNLSRDNASESHARRADISPTLRFQDAEKLPYSDPQTKYHIASDTKYKVNVYQWPGDEDPGLRNFLPRLYDHLLSRVMGQEYDGDEHTFSAVERNAITIVNDLIYRHKVLRVNYTTYDLRRNQDSINPRTSPDIIILSREDDTHTTPHPYWYARVVGIFHTYVIRSGLDEAPVPQRIDFLYVRWFGRDLAHRSGWKARHLLRVGFVDSSDPSAFGFLDPALVVRGVHLIPAFKLGQTSEFLPPSVIRSKSDGDKDWVAYYMNIFVDRDMFMRFRGGGVGHKSTRAATNVFLADRHPFDSETAAEDVEENGEDLHDDGIEEECDSQSDEENEEHEGDDADPIASEGEQDLGPEDGEDCEEEGAEALGYDEL
ncbi:hypothetical protein M378DRAFT_173752, partial [Amanita muscaria Koide BX008]